MLIVDFPFSVFELTTLLVAIETKLTNQSGKKFSTDAGIYYYGEVTRCILVKHWQSSDIPKDANELYYRFGIKEWKKLSKPIATKKIDLVSYLTKFLLEHSTEISELWIRSEEEYRLYLERKRTINSTSINDEDYNLAFKFDGSMMNVDDGKISVSNGGKIFSQYAIC